MRSDERYATRKLLEAAKLARTVLREALEAGPPLSVGKRIPDALDRLAEGVALVEQVSRISYHDVDEFYKDDEPGYLPADMSS